MPVLSKYVVEDSDVSFPDAVLRFVRLRFPLSDEDVVCFRPTMAQVRIFPQFLRLVKEMELVGVEHPAGLFMVDPPAEWASNAANFTVYGDDEELLR
ncbi:hypothetical protein AAVH_07244 [Aphelenchoides avenae]|nr:hypothetical protein AAVH_07244 [Aphelenchus avenae]